MPEQLGIKETQEALVAANEVSLIMINRLKDGVQLADFQAFYDKLTNDEVFKAKLEAAWTDWKLIPAELKDISLSEGLQLATLQISYIPRLVEAWNSLPVVHPVQEDKAPEAPTA